MPRRLCRAEKPQQRPVTVPTPSFYVCTSASCHLSACLNIGLSYFLKTRRICNCANSCISTVKRSPYASNLIVTLVQPFVRPGRLSQLERAGSIGECTAESHDRGALRQGDLQWTNLMSCVIFVIGQIVKMSRIRHCLIFDLIKTIATLTEK